MFLCRLISMNVSDEDCACLIVVPFYFFSCMKDLDLSCFWCNERVLCAIYWEGRVIYFVEVLVCW